MELKFPEKEVAPLKMEAAKLVASFDVHRRIFKFTVNLTYPYTYLIERNVH